MIQHLHLLGQLVDARKIVCWIQAVSRFWASLRDSDPSAAMGVPAARLTGAADLTMVVYLIQKMADSTAADVEELRGATSERAPQHNDKRPPDIAGGANWNTEEA